MKLVLRASGGTSSPVGSKTSTPSRVIRPLGPGGPSLMSISRHLIAPAIADVVGRDRQVRRDLLLHADAERPQIRQPPIAVDRRLVVDVAARQHPVAQLVRNARHVGPITRRVRCCHWAGGIRSARR